MCSIVPEERHCASCCVQERLNSVIEAVRAELDALAEGLHRRASVAAARSVLELMQDTAHAMSKARRPRRDSLCFVRVLCRGIALSIPDAGQHHIPFYRCNRHLSRLCNECSTSASLQTVGTIQVVDPCNWTVQGCEGVC